MPSTSSPARRAPARRRIIVVVGTMRSQYVLQMRVELARRSLERTDGGLKHIASTAAFGSADVMRRAFVRLLGITPRRYRELAR